MDDADATQAGARETTVDKPHGMYEPRDYWPFVTGALAIGGLGIYPAFLYFFGPQLVRDAPYAAAVLISLTFSIAFCYAHDIYGRFLWGRFLAFLVAMAFISLTQSATTGGGVLIVTGGAVGFLCLYASGWLGIWIGRLTGIFPLPRVARLSDAELVRKVAELKLEARKNQVVADLYQQHELECARRGLSPSLVESAPDETDR